uniref:Uncharacterized protein n=1 Tax=Lepisosteus oculatus TaxID=7918 RepID=W5NCC9_LEPOC
LLGLTLLVLLGQLVVSRLCNSLIIAVDSFHTLHLLLQLGVRLWDPARPWRRLQPLGGLVAALLLASLCASVSLDILGHFLQPHAGQRPCLALAAGATGVLLNAGVLAAGCVDGWDASEGSLASAGREISLLIHWLIDRLFNCYLHSKQLRVNAMEPTGYKPALQAARVSPRQHSKAPIASHTAHEGASCVGVFDTVSGCPLLSSDQELHTEQDTCGVLVLTQLLLTPGCQGQRSEGGCRLYVYLDPAFSLAAVLVLLAGALPQLKRHGLLLLQAVPAHI